MEKRGTGGRRLKKSRDAFDVLHTTTEIYLVLVELHSTVRVSRC